jgi:hypothetical protein
MLDKIPEEYTYEYIVTCEGKELAIYYSDAVPPEIGALLNPWEFVSPELKEKNNLSYQGPYKVVEVNHQPKNMDGKGGEVSSQTMVILVVEKK